MIGRHAEQIFPDADVVIEQFKKGGDLAIGAERDVQNLLRVRAPSVTNIVVARETHGQEIGNFMLTQLFRDDRGMHHFQEKVVSKGRGRQRFVIGLARPLETAVDRVRKGHPLTHAPSPRR